MRTIAALLLISVAGCSVPSYSLRQSSTTAVAAAGDGQPAPLVLVPSVRRGHSAMWKTGAIITFCSMGVTLAGAAMTIFSLGHSFDSGMGAANTPLFVAGIISSAAGDGGMLLGGPITWIAGIGQPPE